MIPNFKIYLFPKVVNGGHSRKTDTPINGTSFILIGRIILNKLSYKNVWKIKYFMRFFRNTLSVISGMSLLATSHLAADSPGLNSSRERRLLINWDQAAISSLQLTYAHMDKDPEAKEVKAMLEEIIDEHAKAKIDCITQTVFALPRGVLPPNFKSFYRDEQREIFHYGRPMGLQQLEAAGFDRLQIMIDRAHKHNIEFLGGLRMNDRHNASSPLYDAHPEWQLREYPGGMDYKYDGVRKIVLTFIEEFLERYDVDGLELDWMRWCHMFQRLEAERNAPILTEFVGQVRLLLDQAAAKRGRTRLALGVRIPQTLEECRLLGFDVAAWVRNSSVDFICPSDFFHTDTNIKVEDFVKLVAGTNCRVYPSIHPRIGRGNDYRCHTPESYRAAAQNSYAFGAHGISVYNYQYHWREDMGTADEWPRALGYLTALREPSEIAQGTRNYLFHPLWCGPRETKSALGRSVGKAGMRPTGFLKKEEIELDRLSLDPSGSMDIRIAEDWGAADFQATIRFKVTGLTSDDELALSLNGKTIPATLIRRVFDTDGQTEDQGRPLPPFYLYVIDLAASKLGRFGDNNFGVKLAKNKGDVNLIVRVEELEVKTTRTSSSQPAKPAVKVVLNGESKTRPEDCLTTLVGPGTNQPDAYLGYGGFLGWVSPVRLSNGDWIVAFSAGYWHASAPTPLRFSQKTIESYEKMGLPVGIVAPTGGRAMMIRSTDEGKTWGRPVTIVDTVDDDRHPSFVETRDGTLLCSLFTYPGLDRANLAQNSALARTGIIRSFDHGKTWESNIIRPPSPFLWDETNGPMVLLKDGSVLLTISGTPKDRGSAQVAIFTSKDNGATWQNLSVIKSANYLREVIAPSYDNRTFDRSLAKEHDLDEANATVLADGRWVMMARPEGDISWSSDQGMTWSAPTSFGMRMFAPSLYALRDGTLVCLHGSYAPGYGGLRVIFSTDGGHTWIAPDKNHGFLVSNCYGYAKATELPDGSLFITEQDTGGHKTKDAQSMSIRALRLRIRSDHSGIDLLPASNRL